MENLILGLETGIDGGSLALLKNEKLIDYEAGAGSVSKSEDLLLILDGLLKRNRVNKSEIGLIAVSDGPGSVTGLRIGLAIAKGLGDALSIPFRKISILDAMVSLPEADGYLLAVLRTKKNGRFYGGFLYRNGEAQNRLESGKEFELAEIKTKIDALDADKVLIVLREELKAPLSEYFLAAGVQKEIQFYTLNHSLGEIIGRFAGKSV